MKKRKAFIALFLTVFFLFGGMQGFEERDPQYTDQLDPVFGYENRSYYDNRF